jgi:hypothetical protein
MVIAWQRHGARGRKWVTLMLPLLGIEALSPLAGKPTEIIE